jgi:hypothetical protein
MAKDDDPFDLEKFRLSPEDVETYASKAAPARRRSGRQFTIVPHTWSDRLKAARHIGTYKLAVHLLFLDWKGGGRPITLANAALAKAGVDRRQKWHALTELEHLKLVKIRRRSKKSPLVTLLKT